MTAAYRKRVRLDGWGADVIESQDDQGNPRWIVGSCASPPLGEADEMENYAHFVSVVVKVVKYLNLSRTTPLTAREQAYIDRYIYTRTV